MTVLIFCFCYLPTHKINHNPQQLAPIFCVFQFNNQEMQQSEITPRASAATPNPIYPRYEQFVPQSTLQRLSFMLIRPPKLLYDPRSLRLSPYNTSHKYEVHQIPFDLSLYLPTVDSVRYVILYLHCNSSNRLQGSFLVRNLPPGVGLACFDFEGCGIRDGKWITLGVKEAEEVDAAARWLKGNGYNVVGWGRSMGSVSLLMSEECSIMVADSPFSDLNTLCRESGQHIPYVPNCLYLCLFPCVFCCVQRDIRTKTSCDVASTLNLEKKMAKTDKSKNDQMVSKKHSERLYEKFKGEKKLLLFKGNHNSERPKDILTEVFNWIDAQILRQREASSKNDIIEPVLGFEKTTDLLQKKTEL